MVLFKAPMSRACSRATESQHLRVRSKRFLKCPRCSLSIMKSEPQRTALKEQGFLTRVGDREEAVGFWDRPGKVGSRPGGLRLLGREAQVGGERLQKGKIQKKFHLP